jgi:hypothetical protein
MIVTQPVNASVPDGNTATFSVGATGAAPLSYRWQRGGVDLADGAGISGSGTATLTLNAAAYALNGSQYGVRVSNSAGAIVSASATLTVTPVLPTITAQPASATVTAGTNATFSVSISGGTPPLSLHWRRDGSPIAGATAASFVLSSASAGDNGAAFTVEISNPAGVLISSPALLTVTTPAKAWSSPVRISTNADLVEVARPRAAIDAAGNALVVWRELLAGAIPRHGVNAARFDVTSGWQAPATIDNGSDRPAGLPDVAMEPSGTGTAVFGQTVIGSFHGGFATRYSGGVWQPPAALEDHLLATGYSFAIAPQAPRVAMHTDGAAVAAWQQGVHIVAHRSGTAGSWPLPATTLDGSQSPPIPVENPDVAIGGGIGFAVWRRGDAGAGDIWFSRHAGSGWSAGAPVESDPGNVTSDPVVAVAGNGDALAVWTQQHTASGRFVIRASRHVSGNWSAAVTLSSSSRDASGPKVAVDANGNFAVAWAENLNQSGDILAVRFDAATGAWSATQTLTAPGSLRCASARIGVDGTGNAVVVWLQRQSTASVDADLYASQSSGAGGWSTPLELNAAADGFIGFGSYTEPVIAVNSSGDAILVWHEERASPQTQGIWARVLR